MTDRTIHLAWILALALLALPAGPAAAADPAVKVVRPIGAKSVQQVPPIQKTMPKDTLQKMDKTRPLGTQPSPGLRMLPVGFVCPRGFVKEIRPDHSGGFYSCRIVADRACVKGFAFGDSPNARPDDRIIYSCTFALIKDPHEPACPTNWTISSPAGSAAGSDYHCKSSELRCGAGYRLDPTRHPPQKSGSSGKVYSYRCDAM